MYDYDYLRNIFDLPVECPICGSKLYNMNDKVFCTQCSYTVDITDKIEKLIREEIQEAFRILEEEEEAWREHDEREVQILEEARRRREEEEEEEEARRRREEEEEEEEEARRRCEEEAWLKSIVEQLLS